MSDPRLAVVAKVLCGFTGECACDVAYTSRDLIDPQCVYHYVPNEEAAEDILAAIDEADLRAGIVRTQQGARITASIIQNALRHAADVMPIETLLGADKASVWLRDYAEKWGKGGADD